MKLVSNTLPSAKSVVGIAAAFVLAIPATTLGAVMPSGMISLDIPSSDNGLTINLVTGESTTGSSGEVAGWDVNISGPMIFSAPTISPAENSGFVSRVPPSRPGGVHNLPLDFQVGPAGSSVPFVNGEQPTTGAGDYIWVLPGDRNYVGVYFWNEATTAYHYGWMRFCMSGGGLTDEPRALIEYAYESTPATPILVGAGGVGDPGDCGAFNCFETSAGVFANSKSSPDTDCMVMTADPAGQTLLFQNDIQFNTMPAYANWENTTINGPAGAPADVEWLPAPTDPGPWDAYFRTLTLRDVNLAMKQDGSGQSIVLRWDENGTGQTGLALENASIKFESKPVWQSNASLTLEGTGGTSALLEMPGGNNPSPTTLKVANGATLGFVDCGSLARDRPSSARCYFNSGAIVTGGDPTAENTADIDGGVLEINHSHVIYATGESFMTVRNGGQILVTGSNDTTLQSSRIHVNGGSLKLGDGENFLRTQYNPLVHPNSGNADLILENASVELGQAAQIFSKLVEVRGDSTATLGTIGGDFLTQLNAEGVILTGSDPTLTLAGFRNLVTERLLLDFAPVNSLVRITEFATLQIIEGTSGANVWRGGARMEIEENARVLMSPGSEVNSRIPIQNDGSFVVFKGDFSPEGVMTGSGVLRIDSQLDLGKGVLGPFGTDADGTFTAAPAIIMDIVSTLKVIISPNQNKAQRLIAQSTLDLGGTGVLGTGVLLDLVMEPSDDVALAAGTKFAIVDYVDGKLSGRGFIRDDLSPIEEGDTITKGLNTYRVQYADAEYGAANGVDDSQITLTVVGNLPPVPGNDDLDRPITSRVVKVLQSELLANDTDPDGNPLTITAVGNPQPAGATVSLSGNFAVYTAPAANAGDGSFEYTVSDGPGGNTATGLVTVHEVAPSGSGPNAARVVQSGGDYKLTFIGVPGRNYQIQYTTDTSAPYTWNDLVTTTASPSGVFTYTDANPGDPMRLYRAVLIP